METSHPDEKALESDKNSPKNGSALIDLIAEMKKALHQESGANFKKFFDLRKEALPLFKTEQAAKDRQELWKEFTTLSEEARQARSIADEQSAFAEEQIHLALDATAEDLTRYEEILAAMPILEATHQAKTLSKRQDFYNTLQKDLTLLTTLASRLTALRKEIVKTEIRISRKNKLFEKLSELGDKVFPKRKDAIKVISDAFLLDMQHFAKEVFPQGIKETAGAFYALRDEIKSLQSAAKSLTLNTHAFTEARILLSECWDKLKEIEKERKKAFAIQKVANLEKMQEAKEKINALSEAIASQSITLDEAIKRSDEILSQAKTWALAKEEFKQLKDALFDARKPLLDQAKQQEMVSKEKVRQEQHARQEKINQIAEKLKELLLQHELDVESLQEMRTILSKQIDQLFLTRIEKSKLEPLLRELRTMIASKKEEMMVKKSASAWESQEALKSLLEEKKVQRSEIKNQLDHYRKAFESSGLDLEKAMMYQELIETEKTRLDKINQSIDEISDRIDELEK